MPWLIRIFSWGTTYMKNPYEVLRQKEAQVRELEIQVEALRVAAPLLAEESKSEEEGKGGTLVLPKLNHPAAG
jgi:hypothetical protein